jgi:hypothetical protein
VGNFSIFSQSKTIREGLMMDGSFAKLKKPEQDKFKKEFLVARG